MIYPTTIEEARAKQYGAWAGDPQGTPFEEGKCAAEISTYTGRAIFFYQCTRKAGHGLGGMFCRQHARMVEQEPPPRKIKITEDRNESEI